MRSMAGAQATSNFMIPGLCKNFRGFYLFCSARYQTSFPCTRQALHLWYSLCPISVFETNSFFECLLRLAVNSKFSSLNLEGGLGSQEGSPYPVLLLKWFHNGITSFLPFLIPPPHPATHSWCQGSKTTASHQCESAGSLSCSPAPHHGYSKHCRNPAI